MKPLPDLTRVNGFDYGANDLVLDPKSPVASARRLLADRYTIDAAQLLHHHRGVFYAWTGTRYIGLSEEHIKADVFHFLEYAKRQIKNGLVRFEPNRSRIGEVHSLLANACHLTDFIQSPSWLTDEVSDLDPIDIISCENGLLHLPSRSLMPHTPYFYTHNAIDYRYEPDPPLPRQWLAFLAQLWPDDPQSIETLQEIFGYCLVADTSQQKAFMLVGPKRSGKGTIARILEAVIGSHNVVSPTLAGLASNFGIATFIDKRLAIISDARIGIKTDTNVMVERLLAITGEDSVSVDRKFLPSWQGKLSIRFLIISNELPRIADASGAFAGRIVLLTLMNSFYGREDRGLMARILPERSSILKWAIDGYDRLCERGYFMQPDSARDALSELEELGSPITAFLRDRCNVAPGQVVLADKLFVEWKSWCEAQGRGHVGTVQDFGKNLRTAVPFVKVTRPRNPVSGEQERSYEGIGIAY